MIFATVGTHDHGFDRLVSALNAFAAATGEPVTVQIGSSSVEPAACEWFRFCPPARIEALIDAADVVVTHAGAGSLLAALNRGRPVVAMPRLSAFGEAADDHQLELCAALGEAGVIAVATGPAELADALRAGLARGTAVRGTTATAAGVTAIDSPRDHRAGEPGPDTREPLVRAIRDAVGELVGSRRVGR